VRLATLLARSLLYFQRSRRFNLPLRLRLCVEHARLHCRRSPRLEVGHLYRERRCAHPACGRGDFSNRADAAARGKVRGARRPTCSRRKLSTSAKSPCDPRCKRRTTFASLRTSSPAISMGMAGSTSFAESRIAADPEGHPPVSRSAFRRLERSSRGPGSRTSQLHAAGA